MINAKFSMGIAQNFPDLGGGDQPLIGRDDPLIGEGGGSPVPTNVESKYYWAIDVGAL